MKLKILSLNNLDSEGLSMPLGAPRVMGAGEKVSEWSKEMVRAGEPQGEKQSEMIKTPVTARARRPPKLGGRQCGEIQTAPKLSPTKIQQIPVRVA